MKSIAAPNPRFWVMEEQQAGRWRLRSVPSPFLSLPPRTPSSTKALFPEAQMDRFILCLSLGYPTEIEELQMLQRLADGVTVTDLQPCITLADVQNYMAVRSSQWKTPYSSTSSTWFEPRGRMKLPLASVLVVP